MFNSVFYSFSLLSLFNINRVFSFVSLSLIVIVCLVSFTLYISLCVLSLVLCSLLSVLRFQNPAPPTTSVTDEIRGHNKSTPLRVLLLLWCVVGVVIPL